MMLVILIAICILLSSSYAKTIENEEFLAWFQRNGGKYSPKIDLSGYSSMGNGITAIEIVGESEEIIRVPKKLTFSAHSLLTSADPLHVNIAKAFHKTNEELSIVFALIIEKLKGSVSFFHPYIQVLPQYIPSLVHFNDAELSFLQHADVITSMKSYQKTLKKNYADMIKVASNIVSSDILEKVTYDEFVWASTIFDSRGLRFRGKLSLVPLADMMNYSPHPKIRDEEAGEFFLKYHNLTNDNVVIYSDRVHLPGQQVFEDYGDNTDATYISHHGFVPDINPFRCVKIVGPPFSSLSNQTKEFARSLRFQNAPGRCVDASYNIGQAVTIYLAAISFDSDEIKPCHKRTNLTQPNWPYVFESCGFNDVQTFLQDFVIRNWDEVIAFPRLLQAELQPPGVAKMNDSRFDDLLNDSESLEKRVLVSLRQWLEIIQPHYTTSLEDDIMAYDALDEVDVFIESEYYKPRLHQLLALRYRIQMKLSWANLCSVYGAHCFIWSLAPDNKSNDNDKKSSSDNNESSVGPDTVDDFKDPSSMTMKEKLDRFNNWFQSAVDAVKPIPAINALQAVEMESYRIGTIATRDIDAEEVYLEVPSTIVIDASKARQSSLSTLLDSLTKKFARSDEYHEMIFLLLQQRFMEGSQSDFWPYLSLLPMQDDLLDLPTNWSSEEVDERMYPSFMRDSISQYRERLVWMFEYITSLPEITSFFPSHVLTFDNYLWAASILDSRSIWWNGKRHLVPMLDFVNCRVHASNTSRIHETNLVTGKLAQTKAGTSFKQGEQVFENYGQPNYIYFQFHGFTLISSEGMNMNSHDCVHFELAINQTEGEALDTTTDTARVLLEKLHIRTRAAITSCLAYPIPENVWLFLSLKMNKFEGLSARGQLGKPTASAVKFLADIIAERLSVYEEYNNKHYESRRFIASEGEKLADIHKRLMADYEVLSLEEYLHPQAKVAKYSNYTHVEL